MSDGVLSEAECLVVREFKVHRTLADDTTHAVDKSLPRSDRNSTAERVTYCK